MENKEISESVNKKQKIDNDNNNVALGEPKDEKDNLEQALSNGNYLEDEWFDDLNNDDWGEFSADILDNVEEPNAKRKRF